MHPMVRRLRGLGLGLPAVRLVLDGERSVAEVVAAERAALDGRLADLAWRQASLRAVEEAGPAERGARLDLPAAVPNGGAVRAALIGFWRRASVAPASGARSGARPGAAFDWLTDALACSAGAADG
ncbi:hypothetical protein [Kitasatospora sp. NPDC093806]|uniref:hypothetical protein n=1 Tax=Kitasatospora sp. NPDC093806 TaxID=3155075 RepID=UPI003442C852